MLLYFFSRRRDEERKTLFRNFIFGVEDSLVSTVGLLSGVAAANSSKSAIVTTGIVLIFVEAFSMAIGTFLSEETADQLSWRRQTRSQLGKAAGVMFISYLCAGVIPLFPYTFLPASTAVVVSVVLALAALVLLGVVSARKFKGNMWSKALEMLIMGGLATVVGIAIGSIFQI